MYLLCYATLHVSLIVLFGCTSMAKRTKCLAHKTFDMTLYRSMICFYFVDLKINYHYTLTPIKCVADFQVFICWITIKTFFYLFILLFWGVGDVPLLKSMLLEIYTTVKMPSVHNKLKHKS